jgi:hypothetical protein
MKKILLISLLLSVLLAATSCNKFDEPQPIKHQNTFRCEVNGTEWTPYLPSGSQWGGLNRLSSQYYSEIGDLVILANKISEDDLIDQMMSFNLKMIKIGSNNIEYFDEVFRDLRNNSGCKFYELDTLQSHKVIITKLDTIEKIIQGTFEFKVVNECGHTLNITDGTFDLKPTWFE